MQDKHWRQRDEGTWVHLRNGWRVECVAESWEARPGRPLMSGWDAAWRFGTRRQAMRFAEMVADRWAVAANDMRSAVTDAQRAIREETES